MRNVDAFEPYTPSHVFRCPAAITSISVEEFWHRPVEVARHVAVWATVAQATVGPYRLLPQQQHCFARNTLTNVFEIFLFLGAHSYTWCNCKAFNTKHILINQHTLKSFVTAYFILTCHYTCILSHARYLKLISQHLQPDVATTNQNYHFRIMKCQQKPEFLC